MSDESSVPVEPPKSRRKKFALALLFVALIAVPCWFALFASPLGWWLFTPRPWDDLKFDREVWLKHAGDFDSANPRGQMIDDVRERVRERESTRSDVLELLGKPDSGENGASYSYQIGCWSGLRIDNDTLEIEFDDQGRVKKLYTVQW